MVDNKITKARVKHHFTYSAWKYVLLVALSIIAWDLIYNMTAYRPPADKKIDMYVVRAGADLDAFEAAEMPALQEAFPDMEALNFMLIAMGTQDDYNVTMQFTTYVAAQQGDLFLLPYTRATTLGYAENDGLFLSLQEYIDSGAIDVKDINLEGGKLPDGRGGPRGLHDPGGYAVRAAGLQHRSGRIGPRGPGLFREPGGRSQDDRLVYRAFLYREAGMVRYLQG